MADPDTDTEANNIRQCPRSPTVVRDVRDLETAMDKDKEDLEVRGPPADGSSQDGAQAAEAEEKELDVHLLASAERFSKLDPLYTIIYYMILHYTITYYIR